MLARIRRLSRHFRKRDSVAQMESADSANIEAGVESMKEQRVEALPAEAGDAPGAAAGKPAPLKFCAVCSNEKPEDTFFSLHGCKNVYCSSCCARTVMESVKQHSVGRLVCVYGVSCREHDPKEPIHRSELAKFLTPPELALYDSEMVQHFLRCAPDVRFCPTPTCGIPFIIPEESAKGPSGESRACRDVSCPSCEARFCSDCSEAPHSHVGDGSCKAFMHDLYLQKWDGDDRTWDHDQETLGHAKPCPGCRVLIFKNAGCPHMTCRHCWEDWCWECHKAYDAGSNCDC